MNEDFFMSHHGYAVSIEHKLRNIFKCERGGLGGIIDADYIDSNPFSAMGCAIAVFYNTNENKIMIDNFLNQFYFYNDKSIIEIGKKEFDNMNDGFDDLLKKLK
jgi:hypothetical protein